MTDKEAKKFLGKQKVLFGLEAQGKVPIVESMLAANKSWDEIGQVIGWCGKTAEEYYNRLVKRREAAAEKNRSIDKPWME